MFIKRVLDCNEGIAPDGCRLRETLHPDHEAVDLPYSMADAELDPGAATTPHRLDGRSELYRVVEGTGRMHVGAEQAAVAAGCVVLVPPDTVQWIENTGDGVLRFIVIVSPPWRADADTPADYQ